MRNEDLIDKYGLDYVRARPLISRAQQAAQQECRSYFSSKEDLAHVSCFRKKIKFDANVVR